MTIQRALSEWLLDGSVRTSRHAANILTLRSQILSSDRDLLLTTNRQGPEAGVGSISIFSAQAVSTCSRRPGLPFTGERTHFADGSTNQPTNVHEALPVAAVSRPGLAVESLLSHPGRAGRNAIGSPPDSRPEL